MTPLLIVDRDGTLLEEPADFQIDAYTKLRFVPGALPALLRLRDAGYAFVLVSNQDGLGTPAFPYAAFRGPHELMLHVFASQGVKFRDVLIDTSRPEDHAPTRKPNIGLLLRYLRDPEIDWTRSAVVGDRASDVALAANLGVRAFQLRSAQFGGSWSWDEIAHELLDAPRRAEVRRVTRETKVSVALDLDRATPATIRTGIGFFDHMLEQLATHGGFALHLICEGDTFVDEHHSVEDCAIALGTALRRALGDKRGVARYGFTVPMDEALASAALDLSGRAYFVFEGEFRRERVGDLPTELVPHFFRSLCDAAGLTLHLRVRGENDHHRIEACFKAVARALRQAIQREGLDLPSSKGVL